MRKPLALALVLVSPLALSCNRRVFQEVQNSCDKTIVTNVPVPVNKAADILIVVDNSGSMAEEQANLVDNFLNQNAAECPLQDLKNIDPQFKNPVRDQYTGDGPLAKCGFIQLLAAFESDFRVGVITTDAGLCDNRLPDQQGGQAWGFRPQRGCLQPNGPPGTAEKIIAAADLTDGDSSNDDFAQRFKDTLDNIQIFGSPYERGLDAAAIFLQQEPGVSPNPDCVGDFESFRRPDASLVVMFLSDEDDCSHGLGGDFADELDGEICGAYSSFITPPLSPSNCYAQDDNGNEIASPDLAPISKYKDALVAADPNVKVAVIAGGLGEPGNVEPAGCQVGGDGAPTGGCRNSGGLSNFTNVGDPCDPSAGTPCCTADPGSRYFDLATAIGKKSTDSICNSSFRGTMLDIAAFIAAVDFVELAEPPANPDNVVVQLTKAGTNETTNIPHLPDGADCATDTGWQLEGDTRVVLCGGARPGPGDDINVAAAGTTLTGCN